MTRFLTCFTSPADRVVGHSGPEPPQNRQRRAALRPQLLLLHLCQLREAAQHHVQVGTKATGHRLLLTPVSPCFLCICSYVWEHLEMGYVQGMCDLLAPLMVILDDGKKYRNIIGPCESLAVIIYG